MGILDQNTGWHSLGLRPQTLGMRAPSSQTSDGQESGAVAPKLWKYIRIAWRAGENWSLGNTPEILAQLLVVRSEIGHFWVCRWCRHSWQDHRDLIDVGPPPGPTGSWDEATQTPPTGADLSQPLHMSGMWKGEPWSVPPPWYPRDPEMSRSEFLDKSSLTIHLVLFFT